MEIKGLSIEIVVRDVENFVFKHKELEEYITYKALNKVTLNVPFDWEGFKNGVSKDLIIRYGEKIYFSLCYFSTASNETVYDFEGKLVEGYETSRNGVVGKRYIKKRFYIVFVVNKEEKAYKIFGYALQMKLTYPAVKVLECECFGDFGLQALMSATEKVFK